MKYILVIIGMILISIVFIVKTGTIDVGEWKFSDAVLYLIFISVFVFCSLILISVKE